jgi:2-phospho-L-lactate/phosphoenolpyruvate guanylyltransferase
MTLWAIVPVKSLDRGKTRLAGIFTNQERENLNRLLLTHLLETLCDCDRFAGVLIVSHDEKIKGIAKQFSVNYINEIPPYSLNSAIRSACDKCAEKGATEVLILPSDLPLFDSRTLSSILNNDREPPLVIIAPDRHRQGTNSLLINPLNGFSFHFGENSFARHAQIAEEMDYRTVVLQEPGTELDLDLPEDWTFYQDFVTIKSHQIGG